MPAPGDLAPQRLWSVPRSRLGYLFAPIAGAVNAVATRLDRFQFLTIRQYLSLVFAALVILLLVLAIWHPPRHRHPRRTDTPGAGSCTAAHRLGAQGQGAAPAPPGSPDRPALSRPLPAPAQGGCACRECLLAVPSLPYLVFAGTWVAAGLVPTFATGLMFSWSADLIAIIALLGSARFFLALAGIDVGTSFGGIGSSREVMIASLAEPAMIMIVFTLALIAGSTQLSTVAAVPVSSGVGLRVSLGLALIALIMVAIAENARIPVDNPATHLELTMVHEAMVLEYSGRHLRSSSLPHRSSSCSTFRSSPASSCRGTSPRRRRRSSGDWLVIYVAKLAGGRPARACSKRRSPRCASSAFPISSAPRSMLGLLATLLMFVTRSL